jgi:hypothetical protein
LNFDVILLSIGFWMPNRSECAVRPYLRKWPKNRRGLAGVARRQRTRLHRKTLPHVAAARSSYIGQNVRREANCDPVIAMGECATYSYSYISAERSQNAQSLQGGAMREMLEFTELGG